MAPASATTKKASANASPAPVAKAAASVATKSVASAPAPVAASNKAPVGAKQAVVPEKKASPKPVPKAAATTSVAPKAAVAAPVKAAAPKPNVAAAAPKTEQKTEQKKAEKKTEQKTAQQEKAPTPKTAVVEAKPAAPAKAVAKPAAKPSSDTKAPATELAPQVLQQRALLQKVWAGAADAKGTGKSIKTTAALKWDAWSPAVRADLVKRGQVAVVASIQTKVPRKQWAQWEVTLKFCLGDLFDTARATTSHAFATKEHGLIHFLESVINGQENAHNAAEFQKKLDEMLKEMRDKPEISAQVQNFHVDDASHVSTLRSIRASYSMEFAHYLIAKLVQQ